MNTETNNGFDTIYRELSTTSRMIHLAIVDLIGGKPVSRETLDTIRDHVWKAQHATNDTRIDAMASESAAVAEAVSIETQEAY